jgi:hypothetical protein
MSSASPRQLFHVFVRRRVLLSHRYPRCLQVLEPPLFVKCIASGFAFYIPDRFGRRWILIITAVLMGACMFVVSIFKGSDFANTDADTKGAVAALFIW